MLRDANFLAETALHLAVKGGVVKLEIPRELVELFGSEEAVLREALRLMKLVYLPLAKKLAAIRSVVEGLEAERNVLELEDEEAVLRCLKETRKRIYRKWISGRSHRMPSGQRAITSMSGPRSGTMMV